jgi:hypothetical protein
MADITLDSFQAAQKMACECLWKGNALLRAAEHEPTEQRYADGTTSQVFRLACEIESFCKMLEAGKDHIPLVHAYHLLVTNGPYNHDGLEYSTAHDLAWAFAHRLWLAVYNVLNVESLALGQGWYEGVPGGFALEQERLVASWEAIRNRLRELEPVDARHLTRLIQIESARAAKVSQDDKALHFLEGYPGYIDALERTTKRVQDGDLRQAVDVWYRYPAEIDMIANELAAKDNPELQMLGENRLQTLLSESVILIMSTAEKLGIDPTAICESARICQRVCAEFSKWRDPFAKTNLWPGCIAGNIHRLPEHEQQWVYDAERTLRRLLSKAERDLPQESAQEPLLAVGRWSDLAIGIDGESRYWAILPVPAVGERFKKADAHELELVGDRWKRLLRLLADSPTGNCCDTATLMRELGYVPLASSLPRDGRARRENLEQELASDLPQRTDPSVRLLNNNLKDLRRELQQRVAGPKGRGKAPLLVDGGLVRSGFVVGFLVPDAERHLLFQHHLS